MTLFVTVVVQVGHQLQQSHAKAHKGQKSAGTIEPHIDDLGHLRLEDSETEDDETITEPGSDTMPIISVKTYLKSIYPFEDITDQFNSSDWFFYYIACSLFSIRASPV